jgi:hypothetical protein
MNTNEMEIALTGRGSVFNVSRYFVLPRSSWGVPRIYHECDLLALSKLDVLHEIEIKISKSDLLADKRKRHGHQSAIIKRLWYAVPNNLVDFAKLHIPEDAGLIRCEVTHRGFLVSSVVRRPKFRGKEKPDQEIIKHMYELMAMRYWDERSRIAHKMIKKRLTLESGI